MIFGQTSKSHNFFHRFLTALILWPIERAWKTVSKTWFSEKSGSLKILRFLWNTLVVVPKFIKFAIIVDTATAASSDLFGPTYYTSLFSPVYYKQEVKQVLEMTVVPLKALRDIQTSFPQNMELILPKSPKLWLAEKIWLYWMTNFCMKILFVWCEGE